MVGVPKKLKLLEDIFFGEQLSKNFVADFTAAFMLLLLRSSRRYSDQLRRAVIATIDDPYTSIFQT